MVTPLEIELALAPGSEEPSTPLRPASCCAARKRARPHAQQCLSGQPYSAPPAHRALALSRPDARSHQPPAMSEMLPWHHAHACLPTRNPPTPAYPSIRQPADLFVMDAQPNETSMYVCTGNLRSAS